MPKNNDNILSFADGRQKYHRSDIILPPTDIEFILGDLGLADDDSCDGMMSVLQCIDQNVCDALAEAEISNICMHYDPEEVYTLLTIDGDLAPPYYLSLTGEQDDIMYRMINRISFHDMDDNDTTVHLEIITVFNQYGPDNWLQFWPEIDAWRPLPKPQKDLLTLYSSNDDASAIVKAIDAVIRDLNVPIEMLDAEAVLKSLHKKTKLFTLADKMNDIADFQATPCDPHGNSKIYLSLTSADPSRVGMAIVEEHNFLCVYQCVILEDAVDALLAEDVDASPYVSDMANRFAEKIQSLESIYLLWRKIFETDDIDKVVKYLIDAWDHYNPTPLIFTIPLSDETLISTTKPFLHLHTMIDGTEIDLTREELKNIKPVQEAFCMTGDF